MNEMDKRLTNQSNGTTNINIIHAENIIGSALQQATHNSNNAASISVDQLEEVKDLLSSIRTDVPILQIKKAFLDDKRNASKLAEQYFETLLSEAKAHVIPHENFIIPNRDHVWGEMVYKEIKTMLELRDKIIEFFVTIYDCASDASIAKAHFKKFLQLNYDHFDYFQHMNANTYWSSDPIRWLIYETFLYVSAYLIKTERIEELQGILCSHYQVQCVSDALSSNPIIQYQSTSFTSFNGLVPSINDEARRFQYRAHHQRKNLYSDLILENYKIGNVTKQELIDTDLFLYFASCFQDISDEYNAYWFPYLITHQLRVQLDIFQKAVSYSFAEKLFPIFNVKTLEEFRQAYDVFAKKHHPRNEVMGIIGVTPTPHFIGINQIGTQA